MPWTSDGTHTLANFRPRVCGPREDDVTHKSQRTQGGLLGMWSLPTSPVGHGGESPEGQHSLKVLHQQARGTTLVDSLPRESYIFISIFP